MKAKNKWPSKFHLIQFRQVISQWTGTSHKLKLSGHVSLNFYMIHQNFHTAAINSIDYDLITKKSIRLLQVVNLVALNLFYYLFYLEVHDRLCETLWRFDLIKIRHDEFLYLT